MNTKLPTKCILGLYPRKASFVCDCLELCQQDVTTCCLHEARPVHNLERKHTEELKALKGSCRCHRCGDTNELNFHSSITLCIDCQKIISRRQYLDKLTEKQKAKTRTRACRQCGQQFQYEHSSAELYCEEHRIIIMGGKNAKSSSSSDTAE